MIRVATTFVLTLVLAALPVSAIDFLGVELCQGSTGTEVALPPGSPLVVESVEIGDHGGLVMLLSATGGKVMDHVDDLMTGLTGQRGSGDADTLEWSDGRLTGVAQRVAGKYAALAVTSTDPCGSAEAVPPPTAAAAEAEAADAAPTAAAGASAAVAPASSATAIEPGAAAAPDFEVVGVIAHEAADPTWVDVMGVVANLTATGYSLAAFDVSFFDADERLICVDTISVSVLKPGQERAFRDAIRCPGYAHDAVRRVELQFAGGV